MIIGRLDICAPEWSKIPRPWALNNLAIGNTTLAYCTWSSHRITACCIDRPVISDFWLEINNMWLTSSERLWKITRMLVTRFPPLHCFC
jgi:hypothetical protein